MNTQDLNFTQLLIVYAMLAIPLAIMTIYKIGLSKKSIISIVRMSIQLALVGLYLKFIFSLNSILLNVGWILIMITVASSNVTSSANLKKKIFLPRLWGGIAFSTLSVLSVFVIAAVRPQPFYDARYLIPISGMILGNCMRGNVVGLERFFSDLKTNHKEYMSSIFMGATVSEAVKPWIRLSLASALAPTVSTMATMGIVSLPGMMTGQILGGSSPLTAIKYQMAIMVAIFVAVTLGTWLNLIFCIKAGFNEYGMLREDIFTD
ncbi:MAG: ABC transporter permease [Candidatus Cloacimonetes bacterium]|nr:ABC transporter permease [Candidatus Cloacimonadota bacterium]